nr:ATP synthase F0 subunit 8 [Plator insolens]UMI39146.1 ATP synthase F0 subunit 8 [Plator insolens]
MPQLMPLCWLMSLFMVMLILLMMVDMYLYSEGVLLEIEYEK